MFIVQVPNAKSTICIWLYTAIEDIYWIQTWKLCECAMFLKLQWHCNNLLRVFSSSFLQYGHFFPDPQYENVQHIICCDSYATYAYDFEFANNVGFSRYLNIFLISIMLL